jgi:hypothetical protein
MPIFGPYLPAVEGEANVNWSIRENVITRSVGDEMIVLDMESGACHSLNSVGAAIYRAVNQGAALEAIVEAVVSEFDVESGQAHKDIVGFLAGEAQAGLLAHRPAAE